MTFDYQTGDTGTPNYQRWVFTLNSLLWAREYLYYALLPLTQPDNWETIGTATNEDAAEIFSEMFASLQETSMIGTIQPFVGPDSAIPFGALKCDGTQYLGTDYPQLYAMIDSAFKPDSTHFVVPDLRGRTVIGIGQGSGLTNRGMNNQVGEENHTLAVSEMPAHVHTDVGVLGVSLPLGALPPVTGVVAVTSVTGSTGGSGAHNNMQPTVALNYIIWTI